MTDATFSSARLLALYDRISDAEDAIPRLRRFVLELAVRGKLVEQDAGDEPAAELLTRIAKTRTLQLKARSVKKAVQLDEIDPSEIPFDIPNNWEWVRLNELTELVYGKLLPTSALLDEGYEVFGANGIIGKYSKYLYETPMLLISCRGAYSGTPNISPAKCFVTNNSIVCELFDSSCFNIRYLHSVFSVSSRQSIVTGTAQPQVTIANAIKLPVPLPPLAEQHRIVAKVDELMALCDQLEQARAGREAVRDRLTTASLARLTAPETDAENFQSYARFALQSLPTLTTRPDQIKTLRQTILNLAVRGKLVAQDAEDEPASELLKRIEAGSDRTAKRGARRSNEEDNSVFPFDCPKGWVWNVVQQILDPEREISYGVIKLGAEPKSGGVPTLRCSDVRPGFIDLSGVRKVNETIESGYARTRLNGGEILINIRGTLGGVALVPEKLKGFNVAREVAVVPIAKEIVPQFVVYLMLSPYFWDHIQNNLRGIAYKGLNLGILRSLPIPLPPFAEQNRIVAKVDALMALCNQLEASLTTTATTRSKLLNALLHEALEPAADELEAAE